MLFAMYLTSYSWYFTHKTDDFTHKIANLRANLSSLSDEFVDFSIQISELTLKYRQISHIQRLIWRCCYCFRRSGPLELTDKWAKRVNLRHQHLFQAPFYDHRPGTKMYLRLISPDL